MPAARELWKRIEPIHAVTYFSTESIAAAAQAGLKGFWMGYFGFRAAPMGAPTAGPVHAAFANFAIGMVRRSIPDAWAFATPEDLIEARATAAASALRSLSPTLDQSGSQTLSTLNAELARIVEHGDAVGRPLFSANALLVERVDQVEQLWQLCTTLREHRGDGHVIALAAHRIDGLEAHRLHAAAHRTPHEVLRNNRGFEDEAWEAAGRRLTSRGLLVGDDLTTAGSELVEAVEHLTDELASAPIESAGVDIDSLIVQLTPIATDIIRSGVLPFPNPMGLPQL